MVVNFLIEFSNFMSVKLCMSLIRSFFLFLACLMLQHLSLNSDCNNVNALISLSYVLSGHAANVHYILIDLFLFYSFDVFLRYFIYFFLLLPFPSYLFGIFNKPTSVLMVVWLKFYGEVSAHDKTSATKFNKSNEKIDRCFPKFNYKCQALQLFIIGKLFRRFFFLFL